MIVDIALWLLVALPFVTLALALPLVWRDWRAMLIGVTIAASSLGAHFLFFGFPS